MGGRGVRSLKSLQIGAARRAFLLVVLALLGASFEARGEGRPAAPSVDGNCSVAADTQRWTKQEIFVWERVCAGAIADFNAGTAYGGDLDADRPEGLPESRILRPKFLETILLEDKYRSALPRRGVRIVGARFTKRIDLVNAELKHELWLNDCLLEQGVDFSGAKSSNLLSFDGSKVTGAFTMNASRIDDSVFMRDAQFADITMAGTRVGALELDDSTVTGQLYLDHLTVDGSLLVAKAKLGEVVLVIAHIGGVLGLDGATVTGTLNMDKLRVDSSLFMRHGHYGEVVFRSARVGGTLELDGSTATGTLNMNMLRVDSSLFMRDGQFGEVVLRDANVGSIELDHSKVTGTLNMNKLYVGGAVFMRHGQFSEVVLRSARVGGTLEFDGSTVTGALDMDMLRADSSLFLRNDAKFANVKLTGAHVGGQLTMTDAKVAGNLECYSLVVDQDGLLYDAEFTGTIDCKFSKFRSLYLNNSTFGGDVDLSSGQISGELQLGEAVPQHSAQWSPGKALILRNARAETIPLLTDAWPARVDVNGFTYKGTSLRHRREPSPDPGVLIRSVPVLVWKTRILLAARLRAACPGFSEPGPRRRRQDHPLHRPRARARRGRGPQVRLADDARLGHRIRSSHRARNWLDGGASPSWRVRPVDLRTGAQEWHTNRPLL